MVYLREGLTGLFYWLDNWQAWLFNRQTWLFNGQTDRFNWLYLDGQTGLLARAAASTSRSKKVLKSLES